MSRHRSISTWSERFESIDDLEQAVDSMGEGVASEHNRSSSLGSRAAKLIVCEIPVDEAAEFLGVGVGHDGTFELVLDADCGVRDHEGAAGQGVIQPIGKEATTAHVRPVVVEHDRCRRVVAVQSVVRDVLTADVQRVD